jgi:hypothetical protein
VNVAPAMTGEIPKSYTLVPIDQPALLTGHLRAFVTS